MAVPRGEARGWIAPGIVFTWRKGGQSFQVSVTRVRWDIVGIVSVIFPSLVEGKLFPELKVVTYRLSFDRTAIGRVQTKFWWEGLCVRTIVVVYVAAQSSMALQPGVVHWHAASRT